MIHRWHPGVPYLNHYFVISHVQAHQTPCSSYSMEKNAIFPPDEVCQRSDPAGWWMGAGQNHQWKAPWLRLRSEMTCYEWEAAYGNRLKFLCWLATWQLGSWSSKLGRLGFTWFYNRLPDGETQGGWLLNLCRFLPSLWCPAGVTAKLRCRWLFPNGTFYCGKFRRRWVGNPWFTVSSRSCHRLSQKESTG